MSRGKTVSLLLFASMIFGGQALAWGPEGHAIIAEIAEARLEPAARTQVAQLLSLEDHQHLDEVASWPDAVRPRRPETAPWHFVDIPLTATAYDANRDCVGGDCVVAQIQRFAAVLGDRNAAPQDRLEALKFLVHFVGDIHQPLHCETDLTNFPPPQGDRGGNDIHLTYFHRSNQFACGVGWWSDRASPACSLGAELYTGPHGHRCGSGEFEPGDIKQSYSGLGT